MQKVLHQKAIVQPGGKVEFSSPELEVGQTVDVVVLHESSEQGRSILEILNIGIGPGVSYDRVRVSYVPVGRGTLPSVVV